MLQCSNYNFRTHLIIRQQIIITRLYEINLFASMGVSNDMFIWFGFHTNQCSMREIICN